MMATEAAVDKAADATASQSQPVRCYRLDPQNSDGTLLPGPTLAALAAGRLASKADNPGQAVLA